MKNATFYIVSGVLTVAIIILYILHFTSKSPENGAAGNDLSGLLNDSSITLPIAYVNVDSLLINYNFAKDLNESLLRKVGVVDFSHYAVDTNAPLMQPLFIPLEKGMSPLSRQLFLKN